MAANLRFLSGWKAKAPAPSPSHGRVSFTRASYGDRPPFLICAGLSPTAASAPTTTDVEFVSLAPPGAYPQPPSVFCTDFSQATALPVASWWPPSAVRAWTAAAVLLVSTMVLASHALEASARKGAKAPFAHCCPVSQSTAAGAGRTPTVCWASSARD
ncbi:hypothetical protein SALBM311S_03149 [Streptomyces alboniger]